MAAGFVEEAALLEPLRVAGVATASATVVDGQVEAGAWGKEGSEGALPQEEGEGVQAEWGAGEKDGGDMTAAGGMTAARGKGVSQGGGGRGKFAYLLAMPLWSATIERRDALRGQVRVVRER